MALELVGLQAILQDEQFQQGLKRYADGVSQMETVSERGASTMSKVWAVGAGAVAVGTAAVVAGAAAVAVISKQGLDALNNWGNQLDALGDTLGTTGEQSSTWAIAMRQVGLSVDEGAPALNFFVKQLDDVKNEIADTTGAAKKGAAQLSPFQKALNALGVSARGADGKLRTFDDLMPDLLRAFQRMPDGVQKSALAMDLFGKSGTKFLDFLSQGEDGLEKATRLGKLYGLTMSSEMVQATQDFQNALQVTNLGVQGFWIQIGAKVLPAVTRFVNIINDRLLPPLIEFAQKIAPTLGLGLERVSFILEDFFALLAGEDKLGQFAKNVGDLAGMFGLSSEAVTQFIIDVGTFLDKAIPVAQEFLGWLGKLADKIAQGDWNGVWIQLSQGVADAWDFIQPILTEWSAKFWDWLTNPTTGAIVNAGMELQKIATAIGTWASTAWDSTIAPALADWGTRFWEWLVDPENGAIAQLANKLTDVSNAILEWAENPKTQEQMYNVGYNLADNLISAIGGFFDGKEGDERAVQVLEKLGMALLRAQLSLDRAKYDIGGKIAQGIFDRMAEWFTENAPKLSAAIYDWLNKAADDLLKNLNTLAEKIGTGIANALAEFFKTHPLTLPQLQIPGFAPSSFIPTNTGGTAQQVAFQQMQAIPLSLQVAIDGQEIKNAVVTWVSSEVQSQFGEATASLA